MPLQKIRQGSSFAVIDPEGNVHGTSLSEDEADRLVASSYGQHPGKGRGSMTVPYSYGGSEGMTLETGG